jgi:phage baseplate assembly protein W
LGDYIYDLILQTIFTAPGERVNRPDFGCGIRGLVMDPASVVTAAALRVSILANRQADLSRLIEQLDVDAEVGDASLVITVKYQVRRTGEQVLSRVDIPIV